MMFYNKDNKTVTIPNKKETFMSTTLSIQQLRSDFATVFGTEADHTFFSPGRINLIGEHTDYNGGHVFPDRKSVV